MSKACLMGHGRHGYTAEASVGAGGNLGGTPSARAHLLINIPANKPTKVAVITLIVKQHSNINI